jgi:GNAT superfamily N-acetyltransferase
MIRVDWCTDRDEIDRLADFFSRNVTQSYISHSEVQYGRAAAPDKWIADLHGKFAAEIAERIPYRPDAAQCVARAIDEKGQLIGIAYVTFNELVPIPFFVLEDIVVERGNRGTGIGQQMIDWIFSEARRRGIKRAFLESGKDNHDAHHFFERNGFYQVSIVMMADLA